MADEIDLESGDPDAADAISSRERRRRERQAKTSTESKPKATTKQEDSTLASRICGAFTRIAEQLQARGDDELARAVAEESQPMTTGLMSLTKTVPFLRAPLLVIVGVLEPVLAFGRVARILFTRWMLRRQAAFEEAQTAENGAVTDAQVVNG